MKKAIPLFLVLALLTGLCHERTAARRTRFAEEEDILYLPRISALRVMSLGHHELVATLVFLRAVVYFGGEIATKDKKYTWLDNYLDTIVSLDPQFELVYRWAGTATMYNGQQITNATVERANRYLKLGVEHFPRSWQLPWMLGCNYLFEFQTTDPRQKREWERIGAGWIRQAALLGSAPSWAALLAAQIMRKEGRDEAALRYLEEVYLTTSDENARKEIYHRLIGLRSRVAAEGLEQTSREFISSWHETLPYAHPDLFVLMGPRPSQRMDLEWLGRDQILIDAQKSEQEMNEERAP